MSKLKNYFSKSEIALWISSVMLIIISFCVFDRTNYLTLCASLIGVTSLIFNAKGNPFGQLLMIVFSLLYGIISYSFSYYGEMITYLGMTLPMAIWSTITWIKNPASTGNEVAIQKLTKKHIAGIILFSIIVTVVFYYILRVLDTPNIVFSTISVTTSFIAASLTMLRSSYYALGYAANDIVLIILWGLASIDNPAYIPVLINFVIFFFNDMYGFVSWKKREVGQNLYIV